MNVPSLLHKTKTLARTFIRRYTNRSKYANKESKAQRLVGFFVYQQQNSKIFLHTVAE
jgi:hypothetical protein